MPTWRFHTGLTKMQAAEGAFQTFLEMLFPSLLGNALSLEKGSQALYLQNRARMRLTSFPERGWWVQIGSLPLIREFAQPDCF